MIYKMSLKVKMNKLMKYKNQIKFLQSKMSICSMILIIIIKKQYNNYNINLLT